MHDYISIVAVCCGNWMRPDAAGGISEAELFFDLLESVRQRRCFKLSW